MQAADLWRGSTTPMMSWTFLCTNGAIVAYYLACPEATHGDGIEIRRLKEDS